MLKKFTLLRSQRTRVFELLQEAELEPAEFSWAKEEIAGDIQVSRLNHRDGMVNEPIPACEADDIGRVLIRLSERVGQELKLDGEAVALLRGKFAYLAESARRQRCRDWLYTAAGVCATTAMLLSLSPPGTAALWGLLQSEVRRVLHLTAVPPEARADR